MPVDIEQVKRWIMENPKSVRSIEDIARQWTCSAETMRKQFWRKEKRSLSAFILTTKVEKAKRLLLETDLLCKEVCFEAGFRREDTGADIFKRVVGVTMTRFRLSGRLKKKRKRSRASI